MIPIVAIFNFIAFVVAILLFAHFFISYRKSRNVHIKYFALFYLFAAFFEFLIAVPGLFSQNEILIAYAAAFGYFFLYIALAYAISVPILIQWHRIRQKLVFYSIIALGSVFLILNIIFIEPAKRLDFGSAYAFFVQEDFWIRAPIGAGVTIVGVVIAVFFIIAGRKVIISDTNSTNKELPYKSIRQKVEEASIAHKSYLIAAGFFLLIIAGIVNFAIPPSLWSFTTAGTLSIFGWVVVAFGVDKL